jgi:hypothetical protein
MIDIFAYIVLLILVASAVAIFFIAGSLPGHIAKSRNHPWAQAVTVAGWVTLICGFALWPVALIWAYVDVPAARSATGRNEIPRWSLPSSTSISSFFTCW